MYFKSISFYASILLFLCIAGYAFYNSSSLRSGPTVRIDTPLPYSSVPGVIEVRGNIAHAKEATINGMSVSFTKNGDFAALLVLTPPLDTIDIWAKNAYGKESTKSVQVAVTE